MSKALLSTLGMSPGVITGAYFHLMQEGYGQMAAVVSITTTNDFSDRCHEFIEDTFAQLDERPFYQQIAVVDVEELDNAQVSLAFETAVLEQIETLIGEYDALFINLSGGRKSMVALTLNAIHRYLSANPEQINKLTIFHLELLDDEIEDRGKIKHLIRMRKSEVPDYLNPPGHIIKIIEIPIVPYLFEPKQILPKLFEYGVGAYLLTDQTLTIEKMRYHFDLATWHDDSSPAIVDIELNLLVDDDQLIDDIKLWRTIRRRFNLDEAKGIAFALGFEYEDIEGATLSQFTRELVRHAQRRQMLVALRDRCANERPAEQWQRVTAQNGRILINCLFDHDTADLSARLRQQIATMSNLLNRLRREQDKKVAGWVVTNRSDLSAELLAEAKAQNVQILTAAIADHWRENGRIHIRHLQKVTTTEEKDKS